MITDRVKKTIIRNKLIEKGEHIVLGVSGGPDSVCLLYVLRELSEEWQITLHVVHVNHHLRGEDADADQYYTENLCQSLDIPCHVFHCDVKALAAEQKITEEEAGRKARYDAFEKIKNQIESYGTTKEDAAVGDAAMEGSAKAPTQDLALSSKLTQGLAPDSNSDEVSKAPKTSNVKIAVAHNLNDQAETLLMRIIRGTGTDGLAGIEYIRDETIIRPLLDVSRNEIEAYCKAHKLNPRIDRTNLEPVYTRNRLRLELIPLLQCQYNENILSALNRLVQIAQEDKEYLYMQVDKVKHIVSREVGMGADIHADIRKIARRGYAQLHPSIGKRLIVESLKEIGLFQDMTAVHLDGADNLLRRGKTGDRIDFPGGYGLRLTYEDGVLYRRACPTGDAEGEGRPEGQEERGRQNRKTQEVQARKTFLYSVLIDGITQIPELNASLKVTILQKEQFHQLPGGNRFFACLDLAGKGITDKISIRLRKPGDYIVPLGMKGTKKLQDFFVDEKIPRQDRDGIPLICCGQEVLWVVGHRINENYKITAATTEMVCIEYVPLI